EEEDGVRERAGRDDVLAGHVDAREAEAGQDADGDEVRELAVPQAHRTSTYRTMLAAIARIRSTRNASTFRGGLGPAAGAGSSSGGNDTVGTRSASVSVSSSSGRGSSAAGAASPSGAISNATTVMLSSPPPLFAAAISAFAAASRSRRFRS